MAGRQIAVIGAGLMGSNIALDFARAGFSVTQTDTSVEQQNRCTSVQAAAAAMLHTAGLSPDPPEVVLSRITPCRGLADTVCEADLVIEAISEDLERKQRLFEQLAFYSPSDAVLASNTSSFMPSELAGWTGRAERVLVTHYFNPAHLIPLVELVPGPETDPRVIEELKTLYRDLGKHPVVVRREVPGFIGNRLQFALLREALALVESGVASPEDVDTVVRSGFGRRLPVTGVFQTFDLGGLDTIHAICGVLFPSLSNQAVPGATFDRLIEDGRLGARTGAGWYDYTPEVLEGVRNALWDALLQQAIQSAPAGAH